jgi:hypothetical protein
MTDVVDRKRRVKFVYDKQIREKQLTQRLRIYQFDQDIKRAYYKKETGPLCEYLRSELPLSKEQREAIAVLIEHRLQQRKGKLGRRRGPLPFQETEAMERLIIHLAQKELDRLRAKLKPGKQLPWGTIDKVIEQFLNPLAEDGSLYGLDVGYHNIREALRRGKKLK